MCALSELDSSSIQPPSWNSEAKAAYLACAIDTDGWISLRFSNHGDGRTRIAASVGVVNASVALLERFAAFAEVPPKVHRGGQVGTDDRGIVTNGDVWQGTWSSPPQVIKILGKAMPYLLAKQDRALWTLEFCHSRISPNGLVARRWQPYTPRSWELACSVSLANGRRTEFPPMEEFLRRDKSRYKHQATDTPEYKVWRTAKYRGGMSPEWSEFTDFIVDLGPRPTPKHQLTRLDKTQPYSPSNAHWNTRV